MEILNRKSNLSKTILLSILAFTSLLFLGNIGLHNVLADGGSGSGSTGTGTPAFTNYELAGNQFIAGHSQGISCPNSSTVEATKCENTQAEPQIRADAAGNFYGSSESVFCVIGGQCGGTYAWKSTDAGAHFTTLALPNTVSQGRVGVSPAGGDTDIAVAPRKNDVGLFNIYVASLQSSLANIVVSTSKDGGGSWSINPTGASIPVDDREWIAADGSKKVCISYHAVSATNEIVVDCSFDEGLTFTQHASAFDATHIAFLAGFNNVIGNLAIDPRNHLIYQVFSSVKDLPELVACGISCHVHTVWIGVSIDGGKTFTNYIVYNNPNINLDYGHQFINVSVDGAGNVYVLYSDNHNLFYSFSKTFGQSWSGPFQINKAPSNTAIFPWSSALGNGGLDVVWYGTSYYDGVNPPDNYPSTAAWYVYFAQNSKATTPGSSFSQVAASGIIHYGDVREAGSNCSDTQNRDLLDDIGVAASPTTGLAAIIYTSDQYVNSALEPANSFGSRHCTPSATNTVDCSHTDIAAQTAGSTLKQKGSHFEVNEEDFEELNLTGDGGHDPDFRISLVNSGGISITSISVQLGGLPLNLAWNTAFPLAPAQSASATTISLPLGLVLAVGNIYTVAITATLSDGTIETQTDNAIYSLAAGTGL